MLFYVKGELKGAVPLPPEQLLELAVKESETIISYGKQGKVLAAGPGERDDDGKRIPLDVKEGDIVLFAKYSGTEIKLDDKKVLILRESDLLAIVD